MISAKTIQRGPLVVGFDMDGVIIDHTKNKLILAERYGVSHRPEQTHSEIIKRYIPEGRYDNFQNELYDNSEFAFSAPLVLGAHEGLRELKNSGVPIVLISRRKKPENAIELLKLRGLWGKGKMFDETNAFFVKSPDEKNIVAVAQKVTHHIDDERRVLRAMPDVETRLLFDLFHQFEDEKEFPRVFDWEMHQALLLG